MITLESFNKGGLWVREMVGVLHFFERVSKHESFISAKCSNIQHTGYLGFFKYSNKATKCKNCLRIMK